MTISISASGVITAFGAGCDALWRGLLSGVSCVGPCTASDGALLRGARVPDAALGASGPADRTAALACAAARQLQASAAWNSVDPGRLGVCLGTTQGSVLSWQRHQRALRQDPRYHPPLPGLADPTHALAKQLEAGGPLATVSMACASGAAAIALGQLWLRAGICEAVVAGGVDALSDFVHAGFSLLRALDPDQPRPFDVERAGLGLGEGAALVLLQPGELSDACRLEGCGLSSDAHHLTGPDPTGAGLARAISAALADGARHPSEIDAVNAHGTATLFNDLMESKALSLALGDHAACVPVNSIKGAIGHTMGAAGAIEAVLCQLVLRKGLLPATSGLRRPDPAIALDVVRDSPRAGAYRLALSTSSGFAGVNAALLLGC